jgi:DNA-binding MarR family transcriptional regulator
MADPVTGGDEEPRWLDETEMGAWMALLGVVYRLPQALDRQLRRETGISHSYYSVLSTLSAQPEQSMSMGELAKATDTSPSRLSHAVGILEQRGWVTRRPSPTNGRILFARLTDEGMDMLRRVAPTHVAEVRRRIFDHLSRDQVEQLRSLASLLGDALAE